MVHQRFHYLILFAECGNLAIRNGYITAGMTVRMQFYPSANLKHIVEGGSYRWTYRNRTNLGIVYQKGAVSFDPRLSEENYTLSIHGVRARDEGIYQVECWYKGHGETIWVYSKSADLKLQEPFSTMTSNKPIDIVTDTSRGIAFNISFQSEQRVHVRRKRFYLSFFVVVSASIAQWLEPRSYNPAVVGSSPGGRTCACHIEV